MTRWPRLQAIFSNEQIGCDHVYAEHAREGANLRTQSAGHGRYVQLWPVYVQLNPAAQATACTRTAVTIESAQATIEIFFFKVKGNFFEDTPGVSEAVLGPPLVPHFTHNRVRMRVCDFPPAPLSPYVSIVCPPPRLRSPSPLSNPIFPPSVSPDAHAGQFRKNGKKTAL